MGYREMVGWMQSCGMPVSPAAIKVFANREVT